MARTIEVIESIMCCEGQPDKGCLRMRCPLYIDATRNIKWPYEGTGFGNLYGEPKHADYLAQVRENIKAEIAVQEGQNPSDSSQVTQGEE